MDLIIKVFYNGHYELLVFRQTEKRLHSYLSKFVKNLRQIILWNGLKIFHPRVENFFIGRKAI